MKKNRKTGTILGCLFLSGIFGISNFGGYTKIATEATAMAVKAMDRAESTVTGMGVEGFTGLKVIENIEKWQLSAYENNPNIVEAIKAAQTGEVRLSDLMAGSLNGYFDVKIKEVEGNRVLSYTHKDTGGGTHDVDFKFALDKSSVNDWSGAKEMWVYADFSAYDAAVPMLRVSFEEVDTKNSARKSWRAVSGASYIADGTTERVSATVWDNRVQLPKNFKGWVCWTLDEKSFQKYWSSATCSGMELNYVQQFQIAANGDDDSVGQEYYLDKFSIVGDVNGTELPVSPTGTENYTYKEVWSFDNISLKSYDGSMMAWYGEFAGKMLTGLAMNYLVDPSEELYQSGKALADDLVDAQGEDGYLGRHTDDARYAINADNWDVWNNYHCIYGLYRWYKVSGDKTYLDAACKGLDCAIEVIGADGEYYGSFGQEMNMAISHAFITLYSETGNLKYLQVAEHIVLSNWTDYGDWLTNSESGKEYYQSKLPRWEALHTIMTLGGLYEATGKIRYYNAFEQIWESILKTDVHNDGGFSSGEGACGDPYSTGSIESCCTIAWMAMSTEFLQISKRSDVADELERSYYNAMLGSIMDDGKYITYDTPMNGVKIPALETLAFQYNGGSPDFSCCQANMARGLGQIADWAVLTDDSVMYLNYYGSSEISAKTPSGSAITLKQETAYPSDGTIKVTVALAEEENFNLALRIPTWSKSTTVKINGESCENVESGSYYNVGRMWKNGDVIEISLDMSVHYWQGESNFEGHTSVYYGPILLTLDSAYNNLSNTTTRFNAEDIENAKIVKEDGNIVSVLTRTSDGTPIMLVDFAGAGRSRNSYASWLKIDFEETLSADNRSIWQSRLTHDVFVNDNYVTSSAVEDVAAGESVMISVRSGKTPVISTRNGSVEVKKIGEGLYSFLMPGSDVYVDVL